MAKGRKAHVKPKPSVAIPKSSKDVPPPTAKKSSASSSSTSPVTPRTPKTPADEGIEFFQSALTPGESPINVYLLPLDPDGGPNKDRSVCDNLPFGSGRFISFHSTFVCLQHLCHIFFVSPWMPAHPLPKTACSRPTSRWMAGHLAAVDSPNGGTK
jgi:hypothetical protein